MVSECSWIVEHGALELLLDMKYDLFGLRTKHESVAEHYLFLCKLVRG